MANNRKNRRNTRRANRKNRKNTRRNMRGGAGGNSTGPAPVDYSLSGSSPSQMSLAQGNQFAGYHANQHGGVAPYPGEVVSSGLPADLRATARIEPLDGYFADIRGLRDPNQMGAGRRKGRKGRKASRKGRKASRKDRKSTRKSTRKNTRKGRKASRKDRKSTRRNRRNMRGGAAIYNPDPASTSAPGLLLDPATEAKAIRGMNPEWYLAPDPNAFTPKA